MSLTSQIAHMDSDLTEAVILLYSRYKISSLELLGLWKVTYTHVLIVSTIMCW